MRQFFIFLMIVVAANAYSQSIEEKAAIIACECIKKQKQIDNTKYRECISSSLAEAMTKNGNTDDLSKFNTVTGIQNAILEVQSILSYTCNLLSEKELEERRKIYYSDSENKLVQSSFIIGNDMMRDKKYYFAIESFNIALLADSTFVPVLDNMAVSYKQLGDLENAIKYYNKSLEVYPEGEIALMNIGGIYTSVGEFELSNKYYLRLKTIYPNDPEGYFGLAKNYLLLEEYDKGIENISTAYKIYKKTKSNYIQDTEKIIEIVRQAMKEKGQEDEFNKLAKKYGLKTK